MSKAYAWQWCLNEFNFHPNPGPLSFGLGPYYFILGAQLAPGEKRLVCTPATDVQTVCGKNINIRFTPC